MQYTFLLALSIFVLSIERGEAISLGPILGLDGNRTSDENDNSPSRTKISTVEKFLQTLVTKIVRPIEMASGVNDIISNLPQSLRDPIESSFNKGKRGFGDILNLFPDKFHAIYPGTVWCGAGDIAKSKEDLGLFERTDACCRDHDNCLNYMIANEEKDGLLNNGIFTRSHCSCDSTFYDCLKNAHSILATKIGITYFDILNPQCFADDYPIVNCSKHSSRSLIDNKCVEYNKNYNEKKRAQWFDNPSF